MSGIEAWLWFSGRVVAHMHEVMCSFQSPVNTLENGGTELEVPASHTDYPVPQMCIQWL